MVPMTIEACGNFGGGVGFAQHYRFAVIGFIIMSQAILVAFAATLIAGDFEVAVLGRFDLVCGMTIGADRAAFIALGQQLAVDALVVGLLDFDVALAASFSHVGRVDGRISIDRSLDIVHSVAVVTGRRHNQPHLEQRPPVDAVHVLGGRFGVLHFVLFI